VSNAHHSSESNEHFSPSKVVEPGRILLRGFDLDPASCEVANTRLIRAPHYFDRAMDGFNRPWFGKVWLNPPGGICDNLGRLVLAERKTGKKKRPSCKVSGACGLPPGHEHKQQTSAAKAWWFKLLHEYMSGRVLSAVYLGFNLELQQTTQQRCFNSNGYPSVLHFPTCYPDTRLRFFCPTPEGDIEEGTQPTHANIIVYLPPQWSVLESQRFKALYEEIGHCVWPSDVVRRVQAAA
jgi:hypothetical protein